MSWYSVRLPGGSPNKLVLHQLARRAPNKLVLHQLARRAPDELVLYQLARRAPGQLILHQLPRRALGKLALYQLSGSWQAGIFFTACQEVTLVSWYGMYQLAKRHSQQAGTLPALQEVLPARWYGASLPGGSPNKMLLISAHQEIPEYSAPARWGSTGERFCRVGIWRVPTAGTRLFFHLKFRHPHPYPAPVGGYLLGANRCPQTGAGYPQTGT
ncbi:hypothetical protein PCANC_05153 [Puccinia coronata f. sp. avenae]|uniref:Uncharacterized protein n=1 Tax=Puccinia coronata f. sp. avenae TaxID=200324 RepID=A0A2N5W303_9BASI|nr:hypothetical protein PCANC_05153 [Puccinia coronata f. sp. avenae]